MSSQSLAELQHQAQATYVYWPLWLLLKQRRIRKLLAETGNNLYPEIERLQKYKLPLPDDIHSITRPTMSLPEIKSIRFAYQTHDDHCQLILKHDTQFIELMRVTTSNRWYLEHAVKQFNFMLTHHTAIEVVQTALFWIVCHKLPIPSFNWQDLPQLQNVEAGAWE